MSEIDLIKTYCKEQNIDFQFEFESVSLDKALANDGFLPVFIKRAMGLIEENFNLKGTFAITDTKENQALGKSVSYELQEIPKSLFILSFFTVLEYSKDGNVIDMDDFIYEL